MAATSSQDDTDELLERTRWGDDAGPESPADAAPGPAADDDRRPHGPPAQGPRRPLGRRPGGARRGEPQPGRLPAGPSAAVPRLAAGDRLEAAGQPEAPAHRRGEAERHCARRICDFGLPDESAAALVDRLVASGTSPSKNLMEEELRAEIRAALEALPPLDREVLILRYVERLSLGETAEALGISKGAASTRHTRALARLRHSGSPWRPLPSTP